MGVSYETVGFCPQYFSTWRVPGSSGRAHDVHIAGAESMPDCDCESFKFSKRDAKDCRHIRDVWAHGCLFNPQWKDPGPNDYAQHGIELVSYEGGHGGGGWGEPCPGCGADMIPVRIAV